MIRNMTVNDSTNSLTQALIFGKNNKKPQASFMYRNLAEAVATLTPEFEKYYKEVTTLPLNFVSPQDVDDIGPFISGEKEFPFTASKLPYFPGYRFDMGKSWYRGEDPKEGGYVYAEPGMYELVALLDIASMHPTSIECECSFGPEYTRRFHELKYARVLIKHKRYDEAAKLFNGALAPYLKDDKTAKALSYALKIAINAVYGQTAAKFDNPFRDVRNKDNIVAKRGALFMIDLKHEIQKRGFTVAHIKTDSIKIPNATPEIIKFVMDFGKYYGYTFEHEATYEKMTLVNDAVYIARYASAEWCDNAYGYIPGDNFEHPGEWTATGAQFAVPYVFKSLFSHEPILFDDMCETKETKAGVIVIDYNEGMKDTENLEKTLKKLEKSEDAGIEEITRIKEKIAACHNYKFVGRIGQFCPVLPGNDGGFLYRMQDGKYFALSGTKDYRWLESEELRKTMNIDIIDRSYYEGLVKDAIDTISQYGDFNKFVA